MRHRGGVIKVYGVCAATANGRDASLQMTMPGVGKKVCVLFATMDTWHLIRSLK